jgi:hypothetical protein
MYLYVCMYVCMYARFIVGCSANRLTLSVSITAGANLPLVFAPESGNMLGGTIVNITGPCFIPGEKIQCR